MYYLDAVICNIISYRSRLSKNFDFSSRMRTSFAAAVVTARHALPAEISLASLFTKYPRNIRIL